MEETIIVYLDQNSITDKFHNTYTNLFWQKFNDKINIFGIRGNAYRMFKGRMITPFSAEIESIPYTGPMIDYKVKMIFG
jgi:hypothetical protein